MLCVSAYAQPVKHAVLNESMDAIVGYQMIDPALVAQYAGDPDKAAKVARLRLLVETPRPSATIQEIVEDQGYSITESNVVRVWNVRPLTQQEITARNAENVDGIAWELERRIRGTNWAGISRVTSLQSELIDKVIRLELLNCELLLLVTKAVAGTVATNNLTAPERARVVSLRSQLSFPQQSDWSPSDTARAIAIKDQLLKAYQLWQAGQAARAKIAATNTVVLPNDSSLWPEVEIGE